MKMTRAFNLGLIASIFASIVVSKAESGLIEGLVKPYYSFLDDLYENLQRGVDDSTGNVSVCGQQIQVLLREARSGHLPALKFLDATGKLASGFLEGGTSFPGFFSECLNTRIEQSQDSVIQGKYCLLRFTLPNSSDTPPLPPASWAKLINSKPAIGLCIPSTCAAEEIESAISAAAQSHFSGNITSTSSCSIRRHFSEDAAAICILTLLLVVIALAIAGTCYDIFRNKTPKKAATSSTEILCEQKSKSYSLSSECLLSFSLHKNASKILAVESKSRENIQVLHGLRFYSMVLIIFGHTFSFAINDLFFRNPAKIADAPKNFLAQILANGTLAVDTFYFMSGLLVAYVMLKVMSKANGKFPFAYFYAHRYIRLTPLFLIVIAISATLLRYAGNGPNWDLSTLMYDEWCRKNWWINALYLHNFIDTENMCLSHSWYLATDMQFYVITPLILIPLNIKLLYGAISLAVLFMASALTSGVLTAVRHYPAVPYMNHVLPQPLVDEYYKEVYIKPYCRIGPYLVGIALGYLLFKHKNIILRRSLLVVGWTATAATMLFVIFIMYGANAGNIPSDAAAATYSALARSAWACGIAWMTVACHNGYGGCIDTILSCKYIVPFSRLTYCAYLIHPVIMAVYYGCTESLVDYSNYFMLYIFLGHIVLTYGLSFILTLLFESPLIGLEKVFLQKKTKKQETLECK